MEGINVFLRVYLTTFKSPKTAQRSLGRITGAEIQKDPVTGGFVAYTRSKMDSKKRPEVQKTL